jgi:adenylosuccinate lyase
MPAHPIDFEINQHLFSTPELAQVFDEKTRYQRWLDVEAALAKAQGEMRVIPHEAAKEIERKARLEYLNLEKVHEGYLHSRNSLVPLISNLRSVCEKGCGEYVHYGATTQDIIDTAEILELQETVTIIYRDLRALEMICLDLAARHRSTPMAARTHGQQALPTTFGLKVVIWVTEVRRHIERLKCVSEKITAGQLGGAVGTMAALGPRAMEVAARTMNILGLKHSRVAWHNSRDNTGELASVFSLLVTTLAKIANEIFQLQKTEINELAEPAPGGTVASSTMPHKRNPEMCEQVVVLARLIRANAGLGFEGMINEHERDYRAVRLEWVTITDTSLFVCGLLSLAKGILKDLIVHEDRIRKNVDRASVFISTEALMFRVGKKIGKQTAHRVIYETCMEAVKTGRPLIDLLMNHDQISQKFKREDLEKAIDPMNHIGISQTLTQRVIDHVKGKLASVGSSSIEETRVCPLMDEDGVCMVGDGYAGS